jgi:hypothetical protein
MFGRFQWSPLIGLCSVLFLMNPLVVQAEDGTVYGAGVTGTEITKVSELLEHPDKYVGKTVRVEGLVTNVCAKRGCWLALASDREFETIRFKVTDGEIVFPMSAKGKRGTMEGEFVAIALSKERAIARARRFAEEQGKPFDESSVTGPQKMYMIKGAGGIIR